MISKNNLPEIFNCAEYFIDRNVKEGRGEKTAVKCDGRSLTYSQLEQNTRRFGAMLRSMGIRMEERAALLLHDTEIYPIAFLGAIRAGVIPVCLNTLLRPQDYAYILNDSRARVLFAEASLLKAITPVKKDLLFLKEIVVVNGVASEGYRNYDELMAEISGSDFKKILTQKDDACFWLYSSGTTGKPKGVVHLQHDMVYASQTYGKNVLGIREDDVCFSAAKLFFAYGLGNGLYFPFSVGATSVYLPGRPTPESVYATIRRHRPTIFFGVPTLYGSMLEKAGGMDSVRLCVSAGEALPPSILKQWKDRFGLDILDGIGSTEMLHIFISNCPDDIRPASSGKPVPGYEARIVNEKMEELPDGEIGTLYVKGDSSAPFYWNRHEKTKQTMVGEYLNTGDKFTRDEQGYFYFVGRTDDMLKVGGIWVSPVEVEACILEHGAVLECAVVGFRDKENLVKPKAYVVLKSDVKGSHEIKKDIQSYVKTALAPYKYPREIEFVESLPKTATGKIKRFELRTT